MAPEDSDAPSVAGSAGVRVFAETSRRRDGGNAMDMAAEEVADRLGLEPGTRGRGYVEWLGEIPLEAAMFPEGRLPPFDLDDARALCGRLGLGDDDAAEVLSTLPSPAREPEWWWCVERAVGRLVSHMGDFDAPRGTWPAWEGPRHGSARRCHLFHVALAVAPFTLEYLRGPACRHVPEPLAWAALTDVSRLAGIHRRLYGSAGMDVGRWVALCLRGEMFTLGRLQYNRLRLGGSDEGPVWYAEDEARELGDGFAVGDEGLGVHIPADSPLDPGLVDASIEMAWGFFARHFPLAAPRQRRIATCRSWLLDPQLAEYLPAGSRILAFQRRFTLVPRVETGDRDVVQFVFGATPADPDRPGSPVQLDLDARRGRTAMERAALEHLRSGAHWHRRTGWLELPAG